MQQHFRNNIVSVVGQEEKKVALNEKQRTIFTP